MATNTLSDIRRQAMEKSLGMANSGLSNAYLEMKYWQSVLDAPVAATKASVDALTARVVILEAKP